MPSRTAVAAAMVNPVGFAKGKWKSLFRMVIVIVVVAALGVSAQRSLEHWNQQPPEARLRLKDVDFRWLLLSAGLYAFALLPATMVLSRALNALGSQLPLRKVAAAQLIGHLGKYVPGKAMVIIIRTALLNRGKSTVSLRAATLAITIETLTMISTGAMIALLVLLFQDVPLWMKQISGFTALAAGVSTCPPVLRLVMTRRMIAGMLPFAWTTVDMLAAWFWNALGWLLLGASLAAVVSALPEPPNSQLVPLSAANLYALCLAAIALAYVAGFLSLLPGGVGVREVVLTTMLTSITDPSGALVAAFVLRMIHLIVEVVISAVAWAMLPRTDHGAANVDEGSSVD